MSFEEPEKLSELDRIDREWEKKRDQYMAKTRYGLRYAPSSSAARVFGILAIVMGTIWMGIAVGLAPKLDCMTSMLLLFGAVFIVGAMVISFNQFRMAARYEAALRVYRRRRAEAEEKLQE
jgi:hypothetical protein